MACRSGLSLRLASLLHDMKDSRKNKERRNNREREEEKEEERRRGSKEGSYKNKSRRLMEKEYLIKLSWAHVLCLFFFFEAAVLN